MPDAGEIKFVFRSVSLSHPNTTTETTLVEHLLITEKDTHHFDLSNLSNPVTIRVYEKIDGAIYKLIANSLYPDQYTNQLTGLTDKIVIIILDGGGQDMKITLQSDILEGSTKEIKATVRDEVRA